MKSLWSGRYSSAAPFAVTRTLPFGRSVAVVKPQPAQAGGGNDGWPEVLVKVSAAGSYNSAVGGGFVLSYLSVSSPTSRTRASQSADCAKALTGITRMAISHEISIFIPHSFKSRQHLHHTTIDGCLH